MIEDLPITADGNSPAARRARVKLQPRDKKGRWIPTGASLITAIKGVARKIKGNAIGGTATSKAERNNIRMLVGKGYEDVNIPENTVLTVDPRNAELDTGIKLSRDFLKKKGVNPDVQHTLPKSLADQPQSLEEMDPQPADDLDIELATQGLPENEDKDFRKERDQEPLAKLPPAMEALQGEEAQEAVREATTPQATPEDKVVDDVIAEVSYGGDAPSVDDLIDAAKAPSAKKTKAAAFLSNNDIIELPNGKQAIVRNLKNSKTPDSVDLTWEDEDGLSGTSTISNSRAIAIPASPDKSKFAKKTAPAAPAPAAPADTDTGAPDVSKPKTVAKAPSAPKKKASTPKKPATIPAGRKDDGSDIPANVIPLKDMQDTAIEQLVDPDTGRPLFGKGGKKIEDPNAIYNALLEKNPQAKIDDSGHIILERGDFTDNDGKSYKYEVAVAKTHGNQYMERYRFTDSSGETQSFYHFDYKDSFASIYGDRNGVYVFRDHILGRTSPEKPTRGDGSENRVYKAHWADNKTLDDRIRYFRLRKAAGSEFTADDLNKTQMKLLTPEEVVTKYLEGRSEKHNKSGQARGTKLQSFVGSAWEAIKDDDMTTFEARIVQLLGRLPDSEQSRSLLINTLRDGIKEKFNGTPNGKKYAPLANNIEKKIMTEGFDLRDISRRPFASKDGKTIVNKNDKVRYWNNVGDWSIGEVIGRREPKDGYDDVVYVRFGDNQIALLRSNRMDILGDELDTDLNLHDKDSDLTEYKRNVQGQELRDLRGFSYDFGDEAKQEDENSDLEAGEVGSTADQDAAAPYLGEQGVSADEEPEASEAASDEGNIADFEAGDIWPDEDGDRKGTFVEAQKVVDPDDGTEAWAVIWLDDNGDEQMDVVDIGTSRVPK